jgi:hypothetical protein
MKSGEIIPKFFGTVIVAVVLTAPVAEKSLQQE